VYGGRVADVQVGGQGDTGRVYSSGGLYSSGPVFSGGLFIVNGCE
jgi:hypothetical protein